MDRACTESFKCNLCFQVCVHPWTTKGVSTEKSVTSQTKDLIWDWGHRQDANSGPHQPQGLGYP